MAKLEKKNALDESEYFTSEIAKLHTRLGELRAKRVDSAEPLK